tara:strand:- start:170 stop:1567 length:1398 start_codon:yes stop_codon:yes gene_type:complete
VAETAANRKEYKANKKKTTEQLNSIAAFFGPDDPDRWNKARAIVAGGDSHVAKMSSYFTTAQTGGQDVNDIYKFTKGKDDLGFKGVEDTTNSLVQMAQIAKPSFGASEQTSTLFGSTNLSNVYDKSRKQYEAAGLIESVSETPKAGGTYGSGQLDLTALEQDAKPIAQQKANILRDLRDNKEGTPAHTKALQEQAIINDYEESNSIALKIAMEQNKTKGNPSTSFYQNTLKQGMLEIENKYKSDLVTGPDGQPIDPMKKDAFKTQAILDYKKKFVDNLVREGIDTNGLTVIQSDPQLNNIYKDVLKAEQDKITGGGDTSKKDDKELSFFQQQEKLLKEKKNTDRITKQRTDFKNKYTNISDGVKDLFKDKRNSKEDIFETIKNIYPDKKEAEIYGIVSKVEAELGAKPSSNTVVESVPPRPDSGNLVFDSDAEDAWDDKYGATHFRDGKPKPPKKYGTRRKNRSK